MNLTLSKKPKRAVILRKTWPRVRDHSSAKKSLFIVDARPHGRWEGFSTEQDAITSHSPAGTRSRANFPSAFARPSDSHDRQNRTAGWRREIRTLQDERKIRRHDAKSALARLGVSSGSGGWASEKLTVAGRGSIECLERTFRERGERSKRDPSTAFGNLAFPCADDAPFADHHR